MADLLPQLVLPRGGSSETAGARRRGLETVRPAGKNLAPVGCDEVLFDAGGEWRRETGQRREEEGVGASVLVAQTECVQCGQDRGVGVEREEEWDLGDGTGP